MAKLRKLARRSRPRRPASSNYHTTPSGKTFKLHRSLTDRFKARRDAKALRKAEMLRDMPKGRLQRIFYRLHPKRIYKYWFSREGLIMGLKITGITLVSIFLLLVGLFAYFRKDLLDLNDIDGYKIGGSIRYYDRTGKILLWEDYDAVKRIPVKDTEISQFMKDATIAVEDRAFYEHSGFNLKGILRAGIANLTGGSTTQGGSTITQQLVKLTQNWSRERSYARKIKELILSVEMERTYTKSQILTGYLNVAPYGNIEYGVEAAARDYFHKSAKNLNLAEASFLAAIPKSPSYYSPYGPYFEDGGREDVIGRQHYTLDIMHELGKISKGQRDKAKKVDILKKVRKQPPKYGSITAPYFVKAAQEQLEDRLNQEEIYKRGGWKVITTLDMDLQKLAEQQVKAGLAQVRFQGGDSAAFTAEDVETGQVVALVGGADFSNKSYGQNNYARLALPPGSSVKPYDYAALIEHQNNYGAGTVLYDSLGPLPGYPCTRRGRPPPRGNGNCLNDYDFRTPGPVTLRYALGGSRNIPAVKAMLITGVDKTIDTIADLTNTGDKNSYGYKCYKPGTTKKVKKNEAPCYASSAIGDGAYIKQDEHVHGMATLSRNGVNIPRTYILEVRSGDDKKIHDKWEPQKGTQAVKPDTAYIVADMMEDPRASYMSRKAHRFTGNKGTWKFALKTGTTNDGKDGWLMGFSTKYAAGVWVGHHNARVMRGFMETMTQPIWQGWMQGAHRNLKPKDRAKPSGVQTLPAYIVRTHVGNASIEPGPSTDLFPSWYKNKKAATNKKQVIDIISNKLATECTPDLAKKTLSTSSASSFSGDTFTTSGEANTEEKDDVHKCTDDRPEIRIDTNSNGGNSYELVATITAEGTHNLIGNGDKGGGRVNILIDGRIYKSFAIRSGKLTYKTDYTIDSGSEAVSAQVIDSVLYDGNSGTITITAVTAATFKIEAKREGSNVKVEWDNDVSGAVSYCVVLNSDPACLPITNGGSVPHGGNPSGTATVYAKDIADTTLDSDSDSY